VVGNIAMTYHVVGCHLTQETRVRRALDDAASNIRQALSSGTTLGARFAGIESKLFQAGLLPYLAYLWRGLANLARHVIAWHLIQETMGQRGPGGDCSPRRSTHFHHSSLESDTERFDMASSVRQALSSSVI
jgi:hypothetical protein